MGSLIATRNALHDLARLVLAAELECTTDLVTLRATPGGFGQPERLVGGLQRRVRVDVTSLVVQRGEHESWTPITTLDAASRAASIALPADVEDATRALDVDPTHARSIAEFFAQTDAALSELRRRHASDEPTIAQLFPHHFDLAITVNEVNVGGSPGDADHDAPYLYVGPWNVSPHPQWNEAWGSSLPWTPDITVEEAVQFFEAGLDAASSSQRPA